jgi:hypothetical protein
MRSSFFARSILQLLLLLGSFASMASADEMLQLVMVGTSTNSSIAAIKRAKGDATAILNRFAGREGMHFNTLAPGQLPPSGRMLRGGDQRDETGDEDQSHRNLYSNCPDGCSNSGSPTCVALGCAYCGRCRRRLQPVGRQRVVEADLTIDVQGYCQGAPDCTIMVQVFKVNEDGSTERAT